MYIYRLLVFIVVENGMACRLLMPNAVVDIFISAIALDPNSSDPIVIYCVYPAIACFPVVPVNE